MSCLLLVQSRFRRPALPPYRRMNRVRETPRKVYQDEVATGRTHPGGDRKSCFFRLRRARMESRFRSGPQAAQRSLPPAPHPDRSGKAPRLELRPGHKFFAGNLHDVCLTQKRIERNTGDERGSRIPVQIARRQADHLKLVTPAFFPMRLYQDWVQSLKHNRSK